MIKTELVEKYDKLKDLESGDIAVSKDRKDIFICGYAIFGSAKPQRVVLKLNDLKDQHPDKWDVHQDVKKLIEGDKFIITR